jgi:hypothetical protein
MPTRTFFRRPSSVRGPVLVRRSDARGWQAYFPAPQDVVAYEGRRDAALLRPVTGAVPGICSDLETEEGGGTAAGVALLQAPLLSTKTLPLTGWMPTKALEAHFRAKPLDRRQPAVLCEVPPLREQDQRILIPEAVGQTLDLLREPRGVRPPRPDEQVGEPVPQKVDHRRPLHGLLQHDPRPPSVQVDQGVGQEERVPGTRVPAEHQDRAGLGRAAVLDHHLDPYQATGDGDQRPEPPPEEAMVKVLAPGRSHPSGRRRHQPQAGEPEDREPLEHDVRDGHPGQARGGEATANQEVHRRAREQDQWGDQEGDDGEEDGQRREEEPAGGLRRNPSHGRPPRPFRGVYRPVPS